MNHLHSRSREYVTTYIHVHKSQQDRIVKKARNRLYKYNPPYINFQKIGNNLLFWNITGKSKRTKSLSLAGIGMRKYQQDGPKMYGQHDGKMLF